MEDSIPLQLYLENQYFIQILHQSVIGSHFTYSIHTFKDHYSQKLNKFLSIKEIFDLNLAMCFRTNIFLENKIILIENSEEEILNATKDLLIYINNNFILSEEDKTFQKKFFDLYKNCIKKHNLENHHGKEFKTKISSTFIKKRKNFIFE